MTRALPLIVLALSLASCAGRPKISMSDCKEALADEPVVITQEHVGFLGGTFHPRPYHHADLKCRLASTRQVALD